MKTKKTLALLFCSLLTITSCSLGDSSKKESNSSDTVISSDVSSVSSSQAKESGITDKRDGVDYYVNEEISYRSKVTFFTKHAMVSLPPNYSKNKQYPVVYLLHPLLMNHNFWTEQCKADVILSNLVHDGLAKDMILVSVNSLCNEDESNPSLLDGELIATTYDKTGKDLKYSLIPYIEQNYSVLSNKSYRAVVGASMGGREALLTAFTYQDLFAYLGAFSSTSMSTNVYQPDSEDKVLTKFSIDRRNDGFEKILLTIGKSDYVTNNATDDYDKMMTESGIAHEFVKLDGGHTPSVWSNSLEMFLTGLFE